MSCAPNEPKEVAMASAHSHAAALALKAEVAAKKTAQQKNEQEAEVASPAGVPEKEGEKGEEEGGEEEEGGILEEKKKENEKEKKEVADTDLENALPDEAQRPKWASPSANCWRVSRQDQECRIKVDLLGQCFRIYGGDLSTRGFAWQKHGGAKMAWEVVKKRAGWT